MNPKILYAIKKILEILQINHSKQNERVETEILNSFQYISHLVFDKKKKKVFKQNATEMRISSIQAIVDKFEYFDVEVVLCFAFSIRSIVSLWQTSVISLNIRYWKWVLDWNIRQLLSNSKWNVCNQSWNKWKCKVEKKKKKNTVQVLKRLCIPSDSHPARVQW